MSRADALTLSCHLTLDSRSSTRNYHRQMLFAHVCAAGFRVATWSGGGISSIGAVGGQPVRLVHGVD
jgi:hypothetical protein